MRNILVITILFLSFTLGYSQRLFSIDRYGIMTDSADIKSLHLKYELVGMFQKISDDSDARRARVLKKDANGFYWGFIDQSGNEVIPIKYISESVFNKYGYAKVRENLTFTNKYDCGNTNPCIKTDILPFYYFVDKDGNQVSDYFEKNPEYYEDFFTIVVDGVPKVLDNKTLKTIDQSKPRSKINFHHATKKEYFIPKFDKDGKQDLTNKNGESLTNFQYDAVYIHNNFTLGFIKNGDKANRWYIINKKSGKTQDSLYIDTRVGSVSDYVIDDVAVASNKSGYFLVNTKGKIVSQKYFRIWKAGKVFVVSNDGGKTKGLLNTKGKLVVPFSEFSDIYPIRNEKFVTLVRNKEGEKRLYTFDVKADKIYDFNETPYLPGNVNNYIVVNHNKIFGIRNLNHKLIIPKQYTSIFPVGDTGYFVATNKENKMGMIDIKNRIVIPFTYDGSVADDYYNMSPPHKEEDRKNIEKYWFVMVKGDQEGIINYRNETVFPFDTHHISIWPQFKIQKYNKMGFITKDRKFIPMEYDNYDEINVEKGLYYLIKNSKFGVVDADNTILIPFNREIPERVFGDFYAERYFLFYNNGRYTMVEKGGKLFFPEEFYDAPQALTEGIGFANDFLFDIYKSRVEKYYLEERLDEEDFK